MFLICSLWLASNASRPAYAASYKFTSLGITGGTTVASALDDENRVVGSFTPESGVSEGVVWINSAPTMVPGTISLNALSDNGLAAGRTTGSRHKYVTYDLANGKVRTYKETTPDGILEPSGINATGAVVALAKSDHKHPVFEALDLQGASGVVLQPPGFINSAQVTGINDAGLAVGSFSTGNSSIECFTYQSGTYTEFLPPDPNAEICNTIYVNNDGIIYGTYEDSVVGYPYHGFILNNVTYTFVNYPGASNTFVSGMRTNGEIVGSFYLPGHKHTEAHGFLFLNGTYYELKVPNATSTAILAINAAGSLLISASSGYYLAQCSGSGLCTH
jgi:hypothetical protein